MCKYWKWLDKKTGKDSKWVKCLKVSPWLNIENWLEIFYTVDKEHIWNFSIIPDQDNLTFRNSLLYIPYYFPQPVWILPWLPGLEFRIKSIDTNYSSLYQCVGINALYLLACGIGILGVERLGRRKLLLSSLAGVVVSLLLIGVMFQQADSQAPSVSHSNWTKCQDRKDYFAKGLSTFWVIF